MAPQKQSIESGCAVRHENGKPWRGWLRVLLLPCALGLVLPACGEEAEPEAAGAKGNPRDDEAADDDTEQADEPAREAKSDAATTTVRKDAGAGASSTTSMRDGGRIDAAVVPVTEGAKSDGGTTNGADAGGKTETGATGACTRELVKSVTDQYYKALSARDPAGLPLAADIKLTENAKAIKIGEGMWKSAGATKFKRTVIDTETCNSVTESVVENTPTSGSKADFVVGTRLKLVDGKIAEVESITVGPDGWFPNPGNIVGSASEDWETVLPVDQRPTREQLKKIIDDYFALFAAGGDVKSYPFASNCKRMENGFSPGACNFGIMQLGEMKVLLHVLDVEAGVAVGFVLFAGGLDDFHMIKLRASKVDGVRAVVGPRVSSRGW